MDNAKIVLYVRTVLNENKKVTVGYMNPNATDANLKAFGVALNGLTTNTFVAIHKIVEVDITNAE